MPDLSVPLEPSRRSIPRGFVERPVVFPVGPEVLSGVYCEPAEARVRRGVVLVTGGGFVPGMHRNRTWVHLARRLAEAGWGVLRFDYHGVGESTGQVVKFLLDQPFPQDLQGAVQWMRDFGVAPAVLVGSCFGARTILAVADRIPELENVVLVSLPLGGKTLSGKTRRALPRVWVRMRDPAWRAAALRLARVRLERMVGLRPDHRRAHRSDPKERRAERRSTAAMPRGLRWVSPSLFSNLQRLLARPVRMLLLYGTHQDYYLEYQRAMGQGLDRILGRAAATVDVRTVDGQLHGLSSLATQEFAVAATLDWLGKTSRQEHGVREVRGTVPSRAAGEERA